MAYGHDKKRGSLAEVSQDTYPPLPNASFSTASSLSRTPLPARVGQQQQQQQPASSFFTSQSNGSGYNLQLDINPDEAAHGRHHEPELIASPEAGAHFAYSTTLRRYPTLSHDRHGTAHKGRAMSMPVGFQSIGELVSSVASGLDPGIERDRERGKERDDGRLQKPQGETPAATYAQWDAEQVAANFHTSITNGLATSSVGPQREIHGYNEFTVSTPEPLLIKFAKTIYESPLIMLLFGSAVVSGLVGNVDDAISIAVAIFIVLTVGFVQERRSEKSLEALNKLVPHHCHLIRDSRPLHVLANELVPGDLVTFTVGDRVPADIRLVTAHALEIDESSLTGETRPARKTVERCGGGGDSLSLAERSCIAYMGTLVRSGRGSGIVIATGSKTEFGVVFEMMQDVEEKRTPLQLSMDELAKKLSFLSFGVIGIICLLGVLQKRSWLEMFTIGVSLAVAAIPEGLPIVTTVTLALGVLRMSRRKAIVKKLPSVEALGSVSVICSDKTGTLTKNEQTVVEAYVIDQLISISRDGPRQRARSQSLSTSLISSSGLKSGLEIEMSAALRKTLEVGCVCNNAFVNDEGVVVGQATDVALVNVLRDFGAKDFREGFKRTNEIPFNSEFKYMAVAGVHNNDTQRECLYVKGALETVLAHCRYYYVADESTPVLDPSIKALVLDKAYKAAERGLRVVGMAFAVSRDGAKDLATIEAALSGNKLQGQLSTPEHTRPGTPLPNGAGSSSSTNAGSSVLGGPELIFAGFQAMLDPPRKGVADAISLLQNGGVQVVMITGDSEPTARAIARDLGLKIGRNRSGSGPASAKGASTFDMAEMGSGVMTGAMLDGLSKAQLREVVGGVCVFARTTPRHKMAIVEAFQDRGAVVAMTGDGVNDAPALKMADIGISMGKSGTDVAKEAADMILVDDNFSTILSAVEEGKTIFHNIQNFLSFQLSTAVAALTLITMSTFFGLSNPLNPMQILFINILMDGPPSQSLGVDPADPQIMRKPPRKKDAPIISSRLLLRVLFSASLIVVGTLFVYIYVLSDARMSRRDQTMTFTTFVFLDLVNALQNRGLTCGLTQNKMLIVTVSISVLSQLGLIYVPVMQAVFQTEALGRRDLGTIVCLAGGAFLLHEVRRRYERIVNSREGYYQVAQDIA